MSEDILINVTPQETRVAVLVQGVAQELHVERTASLGLVGNIYLGKVVRVLPGMQSAFIDAGLDRAAFLHVADIWRHEARRDATGSADELADDLSPSSSLQRQSTNGNHEPIEKLLHEGQSLLVQVVKEPLGTKGARLSTQMSIAGRMLVACHARGRYARVPARGGCGLRSTERPIGRGAAPPQCHRRLPG